MPGAPRVVGFIFVPVGIALLGAAWWTFQRQRAILESWPEIEAVVTVSELTEGSSSGTDSTTMYGARFELRYTVNGREYTGRADAGYTTSSHSTMQEKVEYYAPGTRHPIRYNPQNPADIRLDVGYHFGFFRIPIFLGGLGLAFAGAGLLVVFKSRPRSRWKRRCSSCNQMVDSGERCLHCGAALV